MKINFLSGDLALTKNRTGVHLVHHRAIESLTSDDAFPETVKASCYCKESQIKRTNPNYTNEIYSDNIAFSFKGARALAYFLPIELFFGSSDVYICDGMIPHTMNAACKIAIVHDLMVKIYPENYPLISRLYLSVWLQQVKRADAIIAMSNTTKDDLVRIAGIDESRIIVSHPGFEMQEAVEYDPADLSFDIEKPFVFCIGDMRPNKNLLNAIKGFQEALRNHPELRLLIAGSQAGQYEMLLDYVKENSLEDNVVFLGYVSAEEKAALYENALALVFVSLYEGFGIPILEAASQKCPVITSNCSSMKEIAENCSILVNPHDPSEIANAILSLFNKETRDRVIEAQCALPEKYSWEKAYSILKKCITDHTSSAS